MHIFRLGSSRHSGITLRMLLVILMKAHLSASVVHPGFRDDRSGFFPGSQDLPKNWGEQENLWQELAVGMKPAPV